MRVNRRRGAVGEWIFDHPAQVSGKDSAGFDVLLDCCQQIAVVLEEAEVLLPRRVEFHGWYGGRRPDPAVVVTRAGEIHDVAAALLAELERQEGGIPRGTGIEVNGVGVAYDEHGTPHEVPELTWLYGNVLGQPHVIVSTQSDVWLPYDLRGRPQQAVFQRNRGRLERALAAVAARTGLVFAPDDDHTRYAHVSGMQLANGRSADGEVADMIVSEHVVESEGL